MIQEKICYICKNSKSLDQFYKLNKLKTELRLECKKCINAINKISYNKNKQKVSVRQKVNYKNNTQKFKDKLCKFRKKYPEKIKGYMTKCIYDLSYEEYLCKIQEQNNLCAICNQQETKIHNQTNKIQALAIDHDHKTGQLRGLLCDKCNRGLGYFKENSAFIKSAYEYLEKYSGQDIL